VVYGFQNVLQIEGFNYEVPKKVHTHRRHKFFTESSVKLHVKVYVLNCQKVNQEKICIKPKFTPMNTVDFVHQARTLWTIN